MITRNWIGSHCRYAGAIAQTNYQSAGEERLVPRTESGKPTCCFRLSGAELTKMSCSLEQKVGKPCSHHRDYRIDWNDIMRWFHFEGGWRASNEAIVSKNGAQFHGNASDARAHFAQRHPKSRNACPARKCRGDRVVIVHRTRSRPIEHHPSYCYLHQRKSLQRIPRRDRAASIDCHRFDGDGNVQHMILFVRPSIFKRPSTLATLVSSSIMCNLKIY